MARWQSGYAADCKSVYLGSTPGRASIFKARYESIGLFLCVKHSLFAVLDLYTAQQLARNLVFSTPLIFLRFMTY
jgi:hypothetical protein